MLDKTQHSTNHRLIFLISHGFDSKFRNCRNLIFSHIYIYRYVKLCKCLSCSYNHSYASGEAISSLNFLQPNFGSNQGRGVPSPKHHCGTRRVFHSAEAEFYEPSLNLMIFFDCFFVKKKTTAYDWNPERIFRLFICNTK